MKSLEERVTSLEKANRRWRYGAAVTAAIAIGIAAAKPDGGTTDLIRTRRLEVVDDQGTTAAIIYAKDGGAIALYDQEGTTVFGMSGARGSGALDIVDTKNGAEAFITGKGISLYKKGNGDAVFSVSSGDDGGLLSIGNAKGKAIFRVFSGDDGGVMHVNNAKGKDIFGVFAGRDGGFLALNDNDGGNSFTANTSEAGASINLQSATRGTTTTLADLGISIGQRRGREKVSLVDAGIGDGGGGFVSVMNPAGETVAKMQCDKGNAGLITASDFNGNTKESLIGGK